VQLRIGSLVVMLADEFPEMESYGPQNFGGTYGALLDPFGHRWGLTQHLRDVPLAELQELTAAPLARLVSWRPSRDHV